MEIVTIIIKGNLKKAALLKEELSSHLPNNYNVIDKYTENKGHAIVLARQAVEEGAKYIIAAGGDGTVNEVVNGIMTSDEEKRKDIFWGLLPLGTGNDFARSAKVSKSIKELAELIVNKTHINIDIGACRFTGHNKNKVDRYFNNIAEVGLGAKVVEVVANSRKRFGGTMTFLKAISNTFVNFKKPYVKIKSKDLSWSGRIVTVCFANGQYFGSGLGIAPYAEFDDGKLSLVVIGDIKLVHFIAHLPKLRKVKPINIKKIYYGKIETCHLTSRKPSAIEIDGESVGFTPLKVSVIPKALKLLTNKQLD